MTVQEIISIFTGIIGDIVVPLLLVLATVVFLYGVITYITAEGDEDKMATGKTYVIYGIIAMTAMVAVWGIVAALVNSFEVGGVGIPGGPF